MTRKHGQSKFGDKDASPEYRAWDGIIQRCLNPNNKGYQNYGGRGIKICREWRDSFASFFEHVGPRPSSTYSIDRYPNNDGNYEPGNVRWATAAEQALNRRKPAMPGRRFISFSGETLSLGSWSQKLGINLATLHSRLKRGWSIEEALELPTSKTRRKKYNLSAQEIERRRERMKAMRASKSTGAIT